MDNLKCKYRRFDFISADCETTKKSFVLEEKAKWRKLYFKNTNLVPIYKIKEDMQNMMNKKFLHQTIKRITSTTYNVIMKITS